jgi:hypothetical protein
MIMMRRMRWIVAPTRRGGGSWEEEEDALAAFIGTAFRPVFPRCTTKIGVRPGLGEALAKAFPDSKTTVVRQCRTQLYFALGDKPASPDIIFLLSSTGAAGHADEIGMLPLHYAYAFGASEEVLYVLTDAYGEAIETEDRCRRTPLHFALSNAGRKTVPAAVRLLLGMNKKHCQQRRQWPAPAPFLSDYTATIKNDVDKRKEKRESVHNCLERLLHAKPKPTADVLTTLQSLPEYGSPSGPSSCPKCRICSTKNIAPRSHGRSHTFMVRCAFVALPFRMYVVSLT